MKDVIGCSIVSPTHVTRRCWPELCRRAAHLDEAPCHLAVFAEPEPEQVGGLGRRTMPETTAYSAVMAIHTLWLAARAVGLGLGWVSILDPGAVAAALDVPAGWTFIGYFCLGYPQTENEVPDLERLGWERRRPIRSVLVRRWKSGKGPYCYALLYLAVGSGQPRSYNCLSRRDGWLK